MSNFNKFIDEELWVSPLSGTTLFALDIAKTLKRPKMQLLAAFKETSSRYHSTRLGLFWLTVSVIVYSCGYAALVGLLFRAPLAEFLPYIIIGAMCWQMIAGTFSEAPTLLRSNASLITNGHTNFFQFVVRLCLRNMIVFIMGVPVIFVILIIFKMSLAWAWLSLLGVAITVMGLVFFSLPLSFLGVRFPDAAPIIRSLVQFMFYMTPILWKPTMLPEGPAQLIPNLNPVYHFISLIRSPLLGTPPTAFNYFYCLLVIFLSTLLAWYSYGKLRLELTNRI